MTALVDTTQPGVTIDALTWLMRPWTITRGDQRIRFLRCTRPTMTEKRSIPEPSLLVGIRSDGSVACVTHRHRLLPPDPLPPARPAVTGVWVIPFNRSTPVSMFLAAKSRLVEHL